MNQISYDLRDTPDRATRCEPAPLPAVAQRLRDDILGGTYRAGERLPGERELATRLGVHRGAVREALKSLAQIGLVSTRPGGTVVCALQDASIEVVRHLRCGHGLDQALLRQLLDVHEMVVAGAARLAVEQGSDEQLAQASGLVQRLADPGLRSDAVPALLSQLIELVTQASGNLVLRLLRNSIRPALKDRLDEIQRLAAPSMARRPEPLRALDEAIARRDGPAAEEAVRVMLKERREGLLLALARLEGQAATGEAGRSTPH